MVFLSRKAHVFSNQGFSSKKLYYSYALFRCLAKKKSFLRKSMTNWFFATQTLVMAEDRYIRKDLNSISLNSSNSLVKALHYRVQKLFLFSGKFLIKVNYPWFSSQ